MPVPLSIIDLFCGAGGFSLGAHQAGFHVAASVDIDPVLTSCYETNFPSSNLLLADISSLGGDALLSAANLGRAEVTGIIGGPPCQGFSTMGKRVVDDPRNALVEHFFRLIRTIKPAFFLMENVPGLIVPSSREVLRRSIESTTGYKVVGPIIVDAHDMGAATRRKRVVVLGYDPLRCEEITEADIDQLKVERKNTVQDAIEDLPEPSPRTIRKYRKLAVVSPYAERARKMPPLTLGSQLARSILAEGRVTGLQDTSHTQEVERRFSTVTQGETDRVSKCQRLGWSLPAPTLRAGTGPDRGGFQAIRPIHPVKNRVITVREGARLQGFPDWFTFHETKWHSFRMIGNSVSPIVAERLLRYVKSKLKSNTGCDGNEDRNGGI